MTPEKWQKVKKILEEVLETETSERSKRLTELCANDLELCAEVESLLAFEQNEKTVDPLEQSAVSLIAEYKIPKNLIGESIGRYKITGELGAGGMGAVYLAERAGGEFEQKAALKLIKRGMDSDAILHRFLNERQILASLKHPNIAHLIDGGTTADGLPFFVMEYVEGATILEYADAQNLNFNERLNLFREVCAAVSFAHRNLIIHRDLKPSNILVTKDGDVKLLDFGISKILKSENTDDTFTATRLNVFTPEYASPEQIGGEKLTTATDIYSLGVILYELLTGNRPFKTDSKNIGEIFKAVSENEPRKPSANTIESQNSKLKTQNSKLLKGDLDNIILKALRKEPERRYSSVEQFAEDIRRHQEGLPVSARKGTWNYRASKFLQRNKLAVAASVLILVSLVGGFAATLYQRNKAQKRFNDVRQLANSFLFEFNDAIENLPGSIPARELVVKHALEYLDRLSNESSGDAQLQRELATAYEKIGKIQGNSYFSNLGDTDGAMKSYNRSLEIRENLIKTDAENRELQHELANSYEGVGDMLYTANDLEKGLEIYRKALDIRRRLADAEPQNLKYLYSLSETFRRVGDISGLEGYPNLGDTNGAIENYRQSVALGEKLIAAEPENKSYQSSFATWLINLSTLESTVGEYEKAVADGQKAIAVFEKINAADKTGETQTLNLLSAYNTIRYSLSDEMRFDEAKDYVRKTLETLERMSAADPKNAFLRRSLGVSFNALGRIQTDANEPQAAIENHQKALKVAEGLLAADAKSGENQRDVALTLEFLANAQSKSGDCRTALETYRQSLAANEKSSSPSEDAFGARSGIGKCQATTGNLEQAAETFRQARENAEKSAAQSPHNVRKQTRLAIFYLEGGKILAQTERKKSDADGVKISAESKEWLAKSAEIFNDLLSNGKLSKLNAAYFSELEKEMKKL